MPSNAAPKENRLVALNEISDNHGARKTPKRVGRGRGGGRGKTSGRGMKGRKARNAVKKVWFEGGQTPLFKRLPKKGFSRAAIATPLDNVTLGQIMQWVQAGRINPLEPITMKVLRDSNCVAGKVKYGVKLLAKGHDHVIVPLQLEVSYSSQQARNSVERAGGKVSHVYFTPRALRAHLNPEAFPIKPKRDGVPKPKHMYRYPESNFYDVTWLHRERREWSEEERLEKTGRKTEQV